MERIEKDFKELDFTIVDLKKGWSWGQGGFPLGDSERSVSLYTDDGVETRYKFPEFLNEIIDMERRWAREEVQRDIKIALGI